MKIRKIITTNHKLFGSIEIDFTNNDKVVETIIIAGENGSGKTALLELIYDFSMFKLRREEFEKYEFQVEFSETDRIMQEIDEIEFE